MRIYTRKGDNGTTRGLDGKTLSKNDPLIWLQGDADELNAHLGLVRAMLNGNAFIDTIQNKVGKIMAYVSDPNNNEYMITDDDIAELERYTDQLSLNIDKGFKQPGKSVLEAQVQIARAVARRVERSFFAVSETRKLCPAVGIYLNRLSAYLFALSQTV